VGLGLFTALGAAALPAAAIADRLGLLPRPALAFLAALVSLALLARAGAGPGSHYRNPPAPAHFLAAARPP
ncbi:methyltransferase, partial [Mycobacterium tuberculosis]